MRSRSVAAVWVFLETVVAATAASSASSLPNIVFIHSDDHGWADVGYRSSVIDTPNIDSLAAEGLTLERYHTYPICGPTRVGLMTGRSPVRLSLIGNISVGEEGVPLDERLLPETFQVAGYQTWMMGKWHLGGTTGEEYLPQNRGFDHFYGFVGGSVDETTHMSGGALDWQRNGVDVPEDDGLRSTDLMADEAISLIENRDHEWPFFLYLSFHALHTPYDAPQELKDKYAALGLTGLALNYAAMAENMDTQIGRVLAKLDAEGLDDDTLVVFASDNGAQQGKGGSNAPLRGWKNTVFEGGHRVPAVLRWPGRLEAGTTSTQFVSHQDWFPTLTAAAGLVPLTDKTLDGVDRWGALQNEEEGRPRGFVIERGRGTAVLDGDWKILRETRTAEFQLYDVYADPAETTDLAADHPEVVTELSIYLYGQPSAAACDFTGSSTCGLADINLMMAQGNLVAGVSVSAGNQFDLNSDNIINNLDMTDWLQLAGANNGYGGGNPNDPNTPYLRGDTNDLDKLFPAARMVDITDFMNFLTGFTGSCATWECGNFNGDSVVDITDFSNHFLPNFAATGGGTYGPGQAIPEPSALLLLGLGGVLLAYVTATPASLEHSRVT